MAKGTRGRRRIASRHSRKSPYPILTCGQNMNGKKSSTVMAIKDLEDITCSVCMEYPHNAVLLLCSSHDKGCRPYMCGTSSRYSNCLDQYKNAYTKVESLTELACPLCRGQVKGWTVVKSTREYLNSKKRTCMHDDCSFVGVYKELKKHVRSDHPCANPREVNPDQEQKWRRLERDRERDDVISTVTSSMPGSVVFGDYVIERNTHGIGLDSENDDGIDAGFDSNLVNVLLLLHAFGPGGNTGGFRGMSHQFDDNDDGGNSHDDDDGGGNGMSLVNRLRRQGRVVLRRSGRRRRNRVVNRGQT